MSSSKEHDTPIDVRSLERDLKRGKMTRKEHEKALKSLPDVKQKAISMADVSPVSAAAAADAHAHVDDEDDDDDVDDDEPADDDAGPA